MQYDTNKLNKRLWDYYKNNNRNYLPWRKNTAPYFVFISEVMLQQTQVARVEEKFIQFINIFPNIKSLSNAPLADILAIWSGLGYNRRAKFLHECAREITEKYRGRIPASIEELVTLPGIGPNTAGAILVYAFNTPIIFIETNIRRVFIHHFFKNAETVSDKELIPLIEQSMDKKNPREWYWALMDYGSQLPKVVTNPNRKSKHYTKQSAFSGSSREVRGSILRNLTITKKLKLSELKSLTQGNVDAHFENALEQLQAEGFLIIKDGIVTIR